MEFKVDRKTAIGEFEKYCDANDLDCNEADMSAEDLGDFKPLKERFVKACMQGRVVVDGRELQYTVSEFSEAKGDKITVKRPTGHAFMAMDGYKEQQSVHKLQGFVSAMTGREARYFSKLDKKDWMFFVGIVTLFLSE